MSVCNPMKRLKFVENGWKIYHPVFFDCDPLFLQHGNFFLNRWTMFFSHKSADGAVAGDYSMTGNLRRVWISAHDLANGAVALRSHRISERFVRRHPAAGNGFEQCIDTVGKVTHTALITQK